MKVCGQHALFTSLYILILIHNWPNWPNCVALALCIPLLCLDMQKLYARHWHVLATPCLSAIAGFCCPHLGNCFWDLIRLVTSLVPVAATGMNRLRYSRIVRVHVTCVLIVAQQSCNEDEMPASHDLGQICLWPFARRAVLAPICPAWWKSSCDVTKRKIASVIGMNCGERVLAPGQIKLKETCQLFPTWVCCSNWMESGTSCQWRMTATAAVGSNHVFEVQQLCDVWWSMLSQILWSGTQEWMRSAALNLFTATVGHQLAFANFQTLVMILQFKYSKSVSTPGTGAGDFWMMQTWGPNVPCLVPQYYLMIFRKLLLKLGRILCRSALWHCTGAPTKKPPVLHVWG